LSRRWLRVRIPSASFRPNLTIRLTSREFRTPARIARSSHRRFKAVRGGCIARRGPAAAPISPGVSSLALERRPGKLSAHLAGEVTCSNPPSGRRARSNNRSGGGANAVLAAGVRGQITKRTHCSAELPFLGCRNGPSFSLRKNSKNHGIRPRTARAVTCTVPESGPSLREWWCACGG
jgi:hypothetical protein